MPGGTLPALGNLQMVQAIQASITPAATVLTVASTTSTYTIPGLVVGDAIHLNPQAALPATLAIGGVWVSAADTLSIQWTNPSAGSSTGSPTAITCVVLVLRPSNVASGISSYPTVIS